MRYNQNGTENILTIPMPDEKKIGAFHIINRYFNDVIFYRGFGDRYGFFGKEPKITSYGAKFIENTSLFLDSEVDTTYLKKAHESISKNLPELLKYSPGSEIMGQRNDLEFDFVFGFGFLTGGSGHGSGTLDEKRPSGYAAFILTNEDKNDYTDCLLETLDKAYPLLKGGFKAKEDNEGFGVALNSFLKNKEVDMRTTKIINDFIRNVNSEAGALCKTKDILRDRGIENLYKENLNLPELKKKLRKSGFRVTYDTSEFFSRYPTIYGVGELVAFSAAASGSLLMQHPAAIPFCLIGFPLSLAGVIEIGNDSSIMYSDSCSLYDLKQVGYWKK